MSGSILGQLSSSAGARLLRWTPTITRGVLRSFLALIALPVFAQVDITLIDVGQGDSILVTFPPQSNGVRKRMLIDGGESTSANNPVVQFLRSQNIQTLDFVALSHPHFDHYGGLIEVFRQFTVSDSYGPARRGRM